MTHRRNQNILTVKKKIHNGCETPGETKSNHKFHIEFFFIRTYNAGFVYACFLYLFFTKKKKKSYRFPIFHEHFMNISSLIELRPEHFELVVFVDLPLSIPTKLRLADNIWRWS